MRHLANAVGARRDCDNRQRGQLCYPPLAIRMSAGVKGALDYCAELHNENKDVHQIRNRSLKRALSRQSCIAAFLCLGQG